MSYIQSYIQMTNEVLWVPFGLVALISGIIFAVSGYRHGLWRALLEFAATIVAAVGSMLLSGLIAGLLSGGVLAALPVSEFLDAGAFSGLIRILLQGLVQNVLAMVIFFLLMFVTTIILRALSRRIRLGALENGEKKYKLAGMLTGLVCSAVYSIMLLLPYYGTVAAYAPAAERVAGLKLHEERAAMQILRTARSHPLVAASKLPPFAAIYDVTSRVSLSAGGSVSVPEIADTVQHTIVLLQNVAQAPANQREAASVELIDYLRENLAEKPWFYELSMTAFRELRTSFPASDGTMSACFDELEMSAEEFEDNLNAVLDFMLYALEHDFYTAVAEENYGLLYESEIMERAGALANRSPQAVAVKNLMMFQIAAKLCGDDPAQVETFCRQYRLEQLDDPEDQVREAQALMGLMVTGESSPAEFFARHPSLGREALTGIVETYGIMRVLDAEDEFYDWYAERPMAFAVKLEEDPAMQERLIMAMENCVDRPIDDASFRRLLGKASGMYEIISGGTQIYTSTCTMPDYTVVLEVLGREAFADSWAGGAQETWDFLHGYAASTEQIPLLSIRDAGYDFTTVLLVFSAVRDGIVPADSDEGWYLSEILPDELKDDYEHTTIYQALSGMVGNDTLVYMADQMVQEQGRDPLKLGDNLSRSQKKVLSGYIAELAEAYEPAEYLVIATAQGGNQFLDIREAVASGLLGEEALEPLFTPAERIAILKDFFGL